MASKRRLADRLELVPISELEPDSRNVRRHPEKNLEALKKSLERFGQQKPIVVDAKGTVVAGNGTLEAAQALGWSKLWVIRTDLRKKAERTAYALADNKIGDLSHFDTDALRDAFRELSDAGGELELATGFTAEEFAETLKEMAELGEPDEADRAELPVGEVEPLTDVGETWHCGRHLVLVGDVADRLAELEPHSFQCVVTSPPYWGLRDYGTAIWSGGDDPTCDHVAKRQADADAPFDGGQFSRGDMFYQGKCKLCGATAVDSQIGLEPTPDAHCDRLVRIFDQVREKLRPDGVLWLNYGDMFASKALKKFGIKPKDMVGMPWRVALALQRAGWFIRSDVIWYKPNPMPEPSNRGRPTQSHEHLFLLTPGAQYFFDSFAIREPSSQTPDRTRNRHDVWKMPTKAFRGGHFATFPERLAEPCVLSGTSEKGRSVATGAPWRRLVDIDAGSRGDWSGHGRGKDDMRIGRSRARPKGGWTDYRQTEAGWEPPSSDDAGDVEPCRVLDPFGGSGTTMVVCEQTGRDCVSIELSSTYADIAIRRWEEYTGKKAELMRK